MIDKVIRHLEGGKEKAVEELVEWLKVPSISAATENKGDIRRAAEWLRDKLIAAGVKAELKETTGNPVVYGERLDAPGKPTVLVYGHYDVQPPDPLDEWNSPPFEPVIKDGKIYARGASDDKGQLYTHVKAVEAWLAEAGSLPINMKFIFEGEEEVSSVSLPGFLEENKEMLACDVVLISDSGQYAPGMPAITYGLKGLAYLEILVEGPSADLHSGSFGGTVANPVNELARLLGSMHDDDYKVTIPGFYDDVVDVRGWERTAFSELPFDEEEYRQVTGSPELAGEEGYTTLERRWARPTLDVNGIWGGYQGEGAKTIIPARAGAKVSMRLVPNQDPEKITKLFMEYVHSVAPDSVKIEVIPMHGGKPFLLDPKSVYFEKAAEALHRGFGVKPVFIREGGSIPITQTFQEILGADSLLLGWGQDDDRIHSPNEKFDLGDFHRGALSSAYLIGMLGE